MSVNPTYSKQAKDFLEKQPERQASRIRRAINNLPYGDIKKLKGYDNMYRLRIGDFRVVFENKNEMLHVIKIDNRGDVYK